MTTPNFTDPGIVRGVLTRVPPSWRMIAERLDGAAFVRGSVRVIVSVAIEDDGEPWVHVSASGGTPGGRTYLPDWEELKRVKDDFIGPDKWAYQVLPPPADYINQNPVVLHLFARLDGSAVLPDFAKGTGSI